MKPGDIVVVEWRDSIEGSGEPNKRRPAIVIGEAPFFGSGLPFEIVVPLTTEANLAIPGASVPIHPSSANGCVTLSYALSWNVQSVTHRRILATPSNVTQQEVASIRAQVARCIGCP